VARFRRLGGSSGKLPVCAGAFRVGGLAAPAGWLALLAIALSAVAFYYYLLVLKQALVVTPTVEPKRIRVPAVTALTLLVAAALLLVLGALPSLVLRYFA